MEECGEVREQYKASLERRAVAQPCGPCWGSEFYHRSYGKTLKNFKQVKDLF